LTATTFCTAVVVPMNCSVVWVLDTASYSDSTAFVNVSLLSGGPGNDASGDTFDSIENLTGSAHNDLLNGDNDDNVFEGGAGGDFNNGRDGAETASYANSNAAVNVNLLTGSATGAHAEGIRSRLSKT
jgi:serralysin